MALKRSTRGISVERIILYSKVLAGNKALGALLETFSLNAKKRRVLAAFLKKKGVKVPSQNLHFHNFLPEVGGKPPQIAVKRTEEAANLRELRAFARAIQEAKKKGII